MSELGFSHLTDELANALNPESGLPRPLLLRPEQMQQMGMEKAVRHVDAINKWRAAQKAEADSLLANNRATVLHKEYPENNPRGLRWVELKAPDRFENPAQKEEFGDLGRYSRSTLQDALKYEGDTMGHCVGGYCDGVLTGQSRIFSLRDAKGQPHVTIETRPVDRDWGAEQYKWATENPEEYAAFKQKFPDLSDQDREFRKMFAESQTRPTQRIIQIKGKQNLKPNDEYLPFVQDFVRSGQWDKVGDLKNTGLFDLKSLYGNRMPPDAPRFVTREEQAQFNSKYPELKTLIDDSLGKGDWEPEGFKDGGLVGKAHAELYNMRFQPGADQRTLAPLEHRAFAREWARDNPLVAVPSLTAAIPLYSAAKALGLIKARSPASMDEVIHGFKGMAEGLRD